MTLQKGNFNWNTPEVATSFLQGEDTKTIYDSLGDYITQLGNIEYDSESRTIIGSTPFLAASVDSLVRPLGIRVANLRDLSRPEVIERVKGKHYADAPVLVLMGMEDSYERNLPLIKRIAEEVEQANGKVKFPVMISGFDFKPLKGDEKGYGLDIIARNDFTAIYDERLEGKFNGEKFRDVDEFGLPNFDRKGNRTWYARDNGISGLCLNGGSVLGSRNVSLANSNYDGRVVLVSGEGTEGTNEKI